MKLRYYVTFFLVISLLSILIPFAWWSSKPVRLEDVIVRSIDPSFEKENGTWIGTLNITLVNFANHEITIPWINIGLANVSYSDGRVEIVNKTETVSFNDTVSIGNYWRNSVIFWGPNREGTNPNKISLEIKIRIAEANGSLVLEVEANPLLQ